jgi:ABC-type nitrate/sulfonate/bicarbonate transport system permease component
VADVLDRSEVAAVAGQEEALGRLERRWRLSSGWASRLRRVATVVLLFVLWDSTSAAVSSRLYPGPLAVTETLWDALTDGTIWFHAQLTFQRGILGLAIAVVGGVVLGVLLARIRWMDAALEPLVAGTYPVPKLALYPLLILVLGFGAASKVAMVALECAYPIILTIYAAVQSIDKHYFWLTRNVEAGIRARFSVIMRATTPALVASLRMATPIMLVIMVVTEMLGESRGLGYLIRRAGSDFDPMMAMAVILLLGIIGFVLDRIIVFAANRTSRWAGQVRL